MKSEWYYDDKGNKFINIHGEFASDSIEHARDSQPDAEEWKNCIRYAMSQGYPSIIFCTPLLSAAELNLVINIIYEGRIYVPKDTIAEEDVWKITRSELNYEQLEICLAGLAHGICIVDYLNDVNRYSSVTLWWIVFAYRVCHANVCKWLDRDKMSEDEFVLKVQALYRKRGLKSRMDDELMKLVTIA